MEADSRGVRLRLWIDDEEGRHVAVSELRLGMKTLEAWQRAVNDARNTEASSEALFDA